MIEHRDNPRVLPSKSERTVGSVSRSIRYNDQVLGKRDGKGYRKKDACFNAIFDLETTGVGFASNTQVGTLISDNSIFCRSQAYARLNRNLHQFSPRASSAFTSLNLNRQKESK